MLHITGRSRPPGEVGLTPRQYTEWNVVGRAHSTGDLSQQGLLPEVYCTACTQGCAHQTDQIPKNKEPRALCPGGLYSWWHFVSPANGSGSHDSPANGSGPHDCAPVTWAYGIPCPAMVSPNAGLCKEDKLLYQDDHLIWCSKVDSGPRTRYIPMFNGS